MNKKMRYLFFNIEDCLFPTIVGSPVIHMYVCFFPSLVKIKKNHTDGILNELNTKFNSLDFRRKESVALYSTSGVMTSRVESGVRAPSVCVFSPCLLAGPDVRSAYCM